MAVDENALEAAADAIARMKLDQTAIYGPTEYACAVVTAYLSAAPSPAPDEVERAIERLEYLALARAQNATDRNDAKSAGAAARAAISALRQRAAMGELLRMDGEMYDVPTNQEPRND